MVGGQKLEEAKKGTGQVAPQAVQPKEKIAVNPVKTGLTPAELETKKAVRGLIRLDGQEKRWYDKNPKTVDKELNARVKGKAKEKAPIIAEEMQGWVKTRVVPAKTKAPAEVKKPAEKTLEAVKKEEKKEAAPAERKEPVKKEIEKPKALELAQLPGVKAEIIERTYKWYHYIPIIGWAAALLDLGVKKTRRETAPSEQLRDLGLQQYIAYKPARWYAPWEFIGVGREPDERATLKKVQEKTPEFFLNGKIYVLSVVSQGTEHERIVAMDKAAIKK